MYSDAETRKHSVLRVDKIIVDHNNQVWFTRRYMDPPKEKPKSSGITARAFGEDYELVKLEGDQLKRQKIKATSVFDMSLGTDNSLLLATNEGLKLYGGKLREIELPDEVETDQPYTCLLDKHGDYWVSSDRYTWKLVNGNWELQKIYLANDKRFSIPTERFDALDDETIVIGAMGEVFMGNSGNWEQLDRNRIKEHFGRNVNLEYTYVTAKGELFANTRKGLLWIKEDEIINVNTSNSALKGTSVHKLHIDENNTIHFKSEGMAFKIQEDEWSTENLDYYWWYPALAGLAKEDRERLGNYVLKTLKTQFSGAIVNREGVLWVSTYKGIIEFKEGKIRLHDKSNSQFPSDKFYGIAEAQDGNLWLGLDSGVVEWDGKKAIYHALESRYSGAQHKEICFHPNGNVFVSAIDGFHIYDEGKWTHISEGLPQNKSINDMVVDMNGTLWLATYGSGILRYTEKKGIENFTVDNSGLSSNTVFSMDVDKYNNIWLGTQEGLCVFNEGGLVGQAAEDGASPYYRVQANSPYFVKAKPIGKNQTDLKLNFSKTENVFTEIAIFPNPTPAGFTVKSVSVKEAEVSYRLFDLSGRLIQSAKSVGRDQEVSMDLSNQPSGTYLLRVRQEDVVVCERIVKL